MSPKTTICLMKAFAGESQARNKSTFFASVAKKEGYEQISAIFLETADNEKEHAKRLFSLLGKDKIEITAEFPSGMGDTKTNLQFAAEGEKFEWGTMYPDFERIAKKESDKEAANLFHELARVEAKHEKRYLSLLKNVEQRKVFKKDKAVKWHCRNCGYIYEGREAPLQCPACKHPRAYYELLAENY